jgi:peptide/nickel transport system permease protein
MRSAALEVLHEDYIRTAASKGLAPRVVVTRHALRNALIPVVSAVGALVPRLLGGTVVTESVFSWPGMGRLALEAAQGRDYPLITGITVVVAGIAVATTLLVDLAYTRIDPRLRTS